MVISYSVLVEANAKKRIRPGQSLIRKWIVASVIARLRVIGVSVAAAVAVTRARGCARERSGDGPGANQRMRLRPDHDLRFVNR